MKTKVCIKCKKEKSVSKFSKFSRCKDGYNSWCKECHKKYFKEKYIQRKKWYDKIKSNLNCEICGEDHPACLEFHHKDPTKKKFDVSQFGTSTCEKILEEMKKCQILCANCHRKLHSKIL